MRLTRFICVVIALAQPVAAISAPSTDTAAKKGVVVAIAAVDRAMNRRDLHAMEKTLAPDYELYSLNRGVVGKAQYVAELRGLMTRAPANATFHSRVMSMKVEAGGVEVLGQGSVTETKVDNAGVRHTVVSGEVGREFWVKRNGEWMEKQERSIKSWVEIDGKALKPKG